MEFSKVCWVCTLSYLFFSLVLGNHGFKMLSKDASSPPSVPDKKPNVPPLPRTHHTNLNFEMLRKGVYVPTSGFNPKSITLLSPLAHRKHMNFEMLPKGERVPPSGSSKRHNVVPPEQKLNFVIMQN